MLEDKKILFVDIDGVLMSWSCEDHFLKHSVDALNKIIEATDCELVVSSDWRLTRSLKELQDIFARENIKKIPIAKTRISERYDDTINARPHEILDFIDSMNVKVFAVIDDMPLRLSNSLDFHYKKSLNIENLSEWFQKNFFRITDDEKCLKIEDIDRIIEHLNSKNV